MLTTSFIHFSKVYSPFSIHITEYMNNIYHKATLPTAPKSIEAVIKYASKIHQSLKIHL